MVASNMNRPAPVTPGYVGRRLGRAVIELPTVDSIDRAMNWQADQVQRWRKIAGDAAERARRFHRAMDRADAQRKSLLHHIGCEIERQLVNRGIIRGVCRNVGALGMAESIR